MSNHWSAFRKYWLATSTLLRRRRLLCPWQRPRNSARCLQEENETPFQCRWLPIVYERKREKGRGGRGGLRSEVRRAFRSILTFTGGTREPITCAREPRTRPERTKSKTNSPSTQLDSRTILRLQRPSNRRSLSLEPKCDV